MVRFVWEFWVRPDRVSEFERLYSSGGPWAELFRKSPGFRGTTLLRDTDDARRFLTIDCWDSIAAQSAMRQQFDLEYHELDRACEELTDTERRVGVFEEPKVINS
jgi:heme-degrading monooxygenase HmoA